MEDVQLQLFIQVILFINQTTDYFKKGVEFVLVYMFILT